MDQLPWGHIFELIHKVKNKSAREWYITQTLNNGWSRAVLGMQIETQLYERQGKPECKISNFHEQLPKSQSDLAHELLKDPYSFDFITIQGEMHERVIEDALSGSKAPIGISEYALTNTLPNELKTNLPTIEQLEMELNRKNSYNDS